jgi:hypothetical protein
MKKSKRSRTRPVKLQSLFIERISIDAISLAIVRLHDNWQRRHVATHFDVSDEVVGGRQPAARIVRIRGSCRTVKL